MSKISATGLRDRTAVEGTSPTIYIGHRTYRDKHTGREKTTKQWYAEYCIDSRSHYEPLKTTNKTTANRYGWDMGETAPH